MEVIDGVNSFTSVTEIVIVCVSVFEPSDTWTVIIYSLLVSASAALSEFGVLANVNTPELPLIAKSAASAPPLIL